MVKFSHGPTEQQLSTILSTKKKKYFTNTMSHKCGKCSPSKTETVPDNDPLLYLITGKSLDPLLSKDNNSQQFSQLR